MSLAGTWSLLQPRSDNGMKLNEPAAACAPEHPHTSMPSLEKMTLREHMQSSSGVMFVSELLKSARPELPVAVSAKAKSIYERVREETRRLENEQFFVGEKKKELEALEKECAGPCKRFEIHAQREKKRKCAELRESIAFVESGKKLKEFADRVRPYIYEYQKQQFCRPVTGDLGSAPEQSNTVLEEYSVDIEGAMAKFQLQASETCPECREVMHLYQPLSVLICSKCGRSKPFLDATASLLAYSDDYEYCSFSYKRINHFSEWLASIQAKETLDIPQSVLDTIMQHLQDQRVQSNSEVTVHKVRDILKKLKLRKYYEHVQLITCKITGREPPRMTPEMEEKIKVCFLAASSSFQRHCPPDRKNMISYQLVLLKLCELLGYTEFVPYFMLLKCREKLSRMCVIWKKICEDLDWSYIPSIP